MNTALRKIVRDCIEAGIAALGTLVIVLPTNVEDGKKLALAITFAVGAAVVAVLRRELLPLLLNRISPATP